MDPPTLLDEARQAFDDTVRLRRRIHRHPEVGLHLPGTQQAVLEALAGLRLDARPGERLSSVVAVLDGASPGPTILLRADMDALPILESTGLAFASEVDGVMHACGHDAHVAMLLGAARLLATHRDQLAGRVLFAFQPGEEGYAGAKLMIEEGLLERDGTPTAAFALHVSPTDPPGEISTRPGPLMASGSGLEIVVRGRGGHASEPHDCLDPIPIACEIVQALQAYVTRRVNVFDPAVVTITRIEAGTTGNAIPGAASLLGTIRTVSEDTRTRLFDGVRRLAEGIALAHGAEAEVRLRTGYPVLVNDVEVTDIVAEVARHLLGPDRVKILPAPVMPSEDFSYILQRVPGAMVFLGARPDREAPAAPVHSSLMILDEAAMIAGSALHAAVALRFLDPDRARR
ncbi:MAG TPA: M20 family metallopeptidase [Methylomirabilota bacterium]|jgi:hippurate hydrolase|nr:M20 family metallopeptidase [Methylomirabilota bacterium]